MFQKPLHSLGQVLRVWTNLAEEFDSRSDVLLGPAGSVSRFLTAILKKVVIHVALRHPRDVEAPLRKSNNFSSAAARASSILF